MVVVPIPVAVVAVADPSPVVVAPILAVVVVMVADSNLVAVVVAVGPSLVAVVAVDPNLVAVVVVVLLAGPLQLVHHNWHRIWLQDSEQLHNRDILCLLSFHKLRRIAALVQLVNRNLGTHLFAAYYSPSSLIPCYKYT